MSATTDWLTSIGTVGAVAASLYFATRDEVRRVNRERRFQAEQINGWLVSESAMGQEGATFTAAVHNDSNQCVYRMIARLVRAYSASQRRKKDVDYGIGSTQGGFHYAKIGTLPPGHRDVPIRFKGHAAGLRFGVEFAFQDAAGLFWIRRANGALDETTRDPVDLYGFTEPFFGISTPYVNRPSVPKQT